MAHTRKDVSAAATYRYEIHSRNSSCQKSYRYRFTPSTRIADGIGASESKLAFRIRISRRRFRDDMFRSLSVDIIFTQCTGPSGATDTHRATLCYINTIALSHLIFTIYIRHVNSIKFIQELQKYSACASFALH